MKDLIAFCLIVVSIFGLMIGAMHAQGSATDANMLGVFGQDAEFTCEWVSPDRKQAVVLVGDNRRLVEGQHLEVGKKYRLKSYFVHKWAQKKYLTPS